MGDKLGAMCVGDYVVLRDSDVLTSGFVTSDAASLSCGVQRPSPATSSASLQDPLEYSDFVFRIFPALVYRSREEITEKKAAAEAASSGSSRLLRKRSSSFSGSSLNEEAEAEERLLQERAANEDKFNENIRHEVEAGTRRDPIRYGMTIQLQHVKSGLFLCCLKSAAVKDTACRRVMLLDNNTNAVHGGGGSGGAGAKGSSGDKGVGGSAACHLRLLPRYKAQTEGAVCFYSHSIRLESASLGGMFLHTRWRQG